MAELIKSLEYEFVPLPPPTSKWLPTDVSRYGEPREAIVTQEPEIDFNNLKDTIKSLNRFLLDGFVRQRTITSPSYPPAWRRKLLRLPLS